MSVVENQEINFEYFNDIRDSDFTKKTTLEHLSNYIGVGVLVAVLCLCILVVYSTGVLDTTIVDSSNTMLNTTDSASTSAYVDGDEVTSDEFLAIQGVVNSYMKTINKGKSYYDLYNYCKSTSTFADTYLSNTNNIVELYDKYDCCARALRAFGKSCTLNKVDTVIKSDDIYYCYVTISVPTDTDISNYVYQNQYTLLKKFNGVAPTEESIFEYMLDVMETNPLPTTSQSFCIKFVLSNGSYEITDDSFMTSTCTDAYTSAVYKMSQMLGEGASLGK
jgi:hypothetical protein